MFCRCRLQRTAALDQINDQHDNRDDEQEMDNPSADMKAKSEQPKD
jgi:hypothetical protein